MCDYSLHAVAARSPLRVRGKRLVFDRIFLQGNAGLCKALAIRKFAVLPFVLGTEIAFEK